MLFSKVKYKFNKLFNLSLALFCAGSLLFAEAIPVYALPVIDDAEERAAIPIESNAIPNWPQGPVTGAQSAILIDADTGAILYAKNIHEQLYPASTTKILTCLIATERCSMDEIVTFSYDAVFDTPRDSNHIAMDVGYELTMEQCLNAILIASANECAFAVAEHITGTTWEDFAAVMNERAAELGCVDSHFVNPNGLPDENHYTSAYDLSRIGRAFFANELLCKISSSKRLDIPATDNQPKHVIENAKNQLLPGKTYAYEYLVGSKTGYTVAAKSSLVSCAEKDGLRLIAVVLAENAPSQYEDTIALFNYGFSNFSRVNISQTETRFNIDNTSFIYSENDIFGNSKPILSLNTEDCIVLPKTVPFSDVTSSITYDGLDAGQAALITYTYRDQFLGSVSVDFLQNSDIYRFESGTMQQPSVSEGDSAPFGAKVIFVNIFRVILWILGIAGVIALLLFVYAFFTNYQFSGRERSARRSWLRSRRKKRNRYRRRAFDAEEERTPSPKRRKRRKPKHPNRFRDYDY